MNERFWSKVEQIAGIDCWLWMGCLVRGGYGQFKLDGKATGAHRASWIIANGPIPEGMDVLHRCDTPCCIRPSHLFLGTAADNSADMMTKGRHPILRGENHPRAKLCDRDVKKILTLAALKVPSTRIASQFEISPDMVRLIRKGKNWKHIIAEATP